MTLYPVQIPSIKFEKYGKEIQDSIDLKVESIEKDQQALKESIAAICKDRDITVEEVVAAKTEEAIGAYSSKMRGFNGEFNRRGNAALMELQADLDSLRNKASLYQQKGDLVKDLRTISRNLDPDENYTFTYDELVLFGF